MNCRKVILISSIFVFSGGAQSADTETSYIKSRLGHIFEASKTNGQMAKGEVSLDDKLMQCFRDEMIVSQVINSTLKTLQQEIVAGKTDGVLSKLSTENVFPEVSGKADTNLDGISIKEITSKNFKSSYKSYFSDFRLSDASFNVINTVVAPESRNNLNVPNEINLISLFDFRGLDKENHKRQDRGTVSLGFKKVGDVWTLTQIKFQKVESLTSSKAPYFRSIASQEINVPIKLRSEAIRRGGYALSNADVNNDGAVDMLVANRDGLQLFMGTKSGGFELKKDSGLDKLAYVKTAIFADLNNSGKKDLIVTRLEKPPGNTANAKHPASVLVLKGDGSGKFTLVKDVLNLDKRKTLESMPATVADFNGDGLLDIYVGYPGIKDFTANSTDNLKGYSPQGVYLNKGDFKFDDFTDKFTNANFDGGRLFPHASIAANFDQKFGVDLLVADDRGNLSPAFVSNGKTYNELAESIGLGNRGYGMSIAVGDANNDGITDILFTNVNMAAAERLKNYCGQYYGAALPTDGGEKGLRLFYGKGDGKFNEAPAESTGLANAGYGDAGVTFVDYNHDGLQDIYLVNGLWSGTTAGDEEDSLFTISTRTVNSRMIHALKEESFGGFKDFLYKASGNFDYLSQTWKSKVGVRPSLAGFQRNRLFRNNGNGRYTEVAYFEGVDSIADGYVVSKADVDHDGVEDLVLRNSDPGTKEYSYNPVEIYLNQGAKQNKVVEREITLRFEGKESTRDAFGTFVILKKINGQQEVHHLIANSGAVQDEAAIRIYLAKNEKLKNLTVHWTSGKVQVLPIKTPGNYLIREGQSLNGAISSL